MPGKKIFNNVVDRHAPFRTKRIRGSKAPWITTELKEVMHQRDVLKIKAIQTKNPQDWSALKKKTCKGRTLQNRLL